MTANDLVNYQRRSKKKLTSEAQNCQIVCFHNSEQSGSFVGVGRSKRCWVKIVDRLSAKKEDKVQFKYRRRVTTHRRSQRSQGSPVAKPEGTNRRPLLRSLKLSTTSAQQSNKKAILHAYVPPCPLVSRNVGERDFINEGRGHRCPCLTQNSDS